MRETRTSSRKATASFRLSASRRSTSLTRCCSSTPRSERSASFASAIRRSSWTSESHSATRSASRASFGPGSRRPHQRPCHDRELQGTRGYRRRASGAEGRIRDRVNDPKLQGARACRRCPSGALLLGGTGPLRFRTRPPTNTRPHLTRPPAERKGTPRPSSRMASATRRLTRAVRSALGSVGAS